MHNHNSANGAILLVLVSVLVFLNSPVIVASSSSTKCATLYTEQSFRGRPYSLGDGDQQPSLRSLAFLPSSVQVFPGCFLMTFDNYGYNQTMDKDMDRLGWNSYRMLSAACCECNGCSGSANKLGDSCARLFENPRCDGCSGFRLDLKNGNKFRNFGVLRNRMTSVAVRRGCTLTVYSETEFGGWRANFRESTNVMGDNWFKQISSAKCGCGNAPVTLPTVPTTWRPPNTLPTVSVTWRLPITLPTVPVTWRPPVTLPTVPSNTWPQITLPTVPTTTNKAPTLGYEYYEEESEESSDEVFDNSNFFGEQGSDEILTTTTTTAKPTTTTTSSWKAETHGFVYWYEDEEEEEEEEDDDDWDF